MTLPELTDYAKRLRASALVQFWCVEDGVIGKLIPEFNREFWNGFDDVDADRQALLNRYIAVKRANPECFRQPQTMAT